MGEECVVPSLATIRILAYLMIAAAIFIAGATVAHKIDKAQLLTLQLSYAKAQQTAVEKAMAEQSVEDKIALDAAVTEAQAQQKIVTQTVTLTKTVDHYVKDDSTCITWGLVRLLNAASQGGDPNTVPIPTGKSDDACAPVSARALAANVVGNYAAARANAEQLNALEATIRSMMETAGAKS